MLFDNADQNNSFFLLSALLLALGFGWPELVSVGHELFVYGWGIGGFARDGRADWESFEMSG